MLEPFTRWRFALAPESPWSGVQARATTYERALICVRVPLPAQASAECQHLVSRMLQPNPAHRLSLDEVLKHPWVTCDMPLQLATLNRRLLHVRHSGTALTPVMVVSPQSAVVAASRDLRAGTSRVAVVHVTQTCWGTCVCHKLRRFVSLCRSQRQEGANRRPATLSTSSARCR